MEKENPPQETETEGQAPIENKTDDMDFAARYHTAKQKEMATLAEEMEARSASENRAKHRKWWIKTVLMLILIAASIALLFGITDLVAGESMSSFRSMVKNIHLPYFFLLIGVVVIFILLESLKYSYLLKISTGKWRFKNSVKVMFLGKYYDGITPLGTGGQPFQIYYLHKKDIPAGVATAVPLVKYIVNTVTVCVLAGGFFIFATTFLPLGWGDTTLLVVAWISMAANFIVPVAMLIASMFPRWGKKFTVKFVGFLHKIHIVKHKYPTMRKYVYEIDEYRNSLRAIIRRWWLILPLVFICAFDTVVSFSLPYFVMLSVAGRVCPDVANARALLEIICLSFISYYSASLIPTPGNSGALEVTASVIFATVLTKYEQIAPLIGWIVLVWRLFSYYLYILSGIGINIFEIIRSAVRQRRAAKKEAGDG